MRTGPAVKTRYQMAVSEFEAARQRAALQEIVARFIGKPVSLLSYHQVAEQLRVVGRAERGLRTIPVAAIVGSVGRYNDFTREFLPRMARDAHRWAGVKAAATNVGDLPPIEVYQIGEAYFVLDGNHRVSVAREQGVDYLEALVTEVRTRVPMALADSADELIAKAEYAAFLEYTGLDKVRPEAVLAVSVPGQYRHLENLIEVHRFFLEEAEGEAIEWTEAVKRWYDESYLPVVEAIREQEILTRFPQRTETDLFIWLAVHRAALQHRLAWEMGAEATVSVLAAKLKPPRRRLVGWLARFGHRLRGKLGGRAAPGAGLSWSRGKRLARYSEGLFADILLLYGAEAPALAASARLLIRRERAHLHVVVPGGAGEGVFVPQEEERGQVSVSVTEVGLVEALAERVGLADLILLSRSLLLGSGREQANRLLALMAQAGRPVLVGPLPAGGPEAIWLVQEAHLEGECALFVATYLAEQWDLPLVWAGEGSDEETWAHAQAYAALHEVSLLRQGTGDNREAALPVVPMIRRSRFGGGRMERGLVTRLETMEGALLLAP